MKRTTIGLSVMVIVFLLGVFVALNSLVWMGGKLDSTAITTLRVPILLITFLDPLAILLEVVAVILIIMDSGLVGKSHHRLALTAAIFLIIWGIMNVGGFIPLSIAGMHRESLSLVKAGQLVKAGAALLHYLVPFLLVFSLTNKWLRTLLWLALVTTVVGNLGTVVLSLSGMWLEPSEISGKTLSMLRIDVDYTAGAFPFLLGMGYAGCVLYLVVYTFLTWRTWRSGGTGKESQDSSLLSSIWR